MRVRILQIIKILITCDCVKTIAAIAEEIKVSKKTVRNDLNSVQEYLNSNNLKLIKKTGVGLYIEGDENEKLKLLSSIKYYKAGNMKLTSNDRQLYILFQVLSQNKNVTIKSLRDELFISRPSVYNDLEKVKNWLANRDIEMDYSSKKGINIIAGEKRIRKAIFDLFKKSNEYDEIVELLESKNDLANYYSYAQKEDLIGIDYVKVKEMLSSYNNNRNLLFTENGLNRLTIKFAIAIYRISSGKHVDMSQATIKELKRTSIYESLESLSKDLADTFSIEFTDAEIAYLVGNTIGSKTHYVEIDWTLDTEMFTLSKIVAQEIIEVTKQYYNIDFDESFLSGLMHHLKSVSNKIKYGLDFYNDFIEEIKLNYAYAFKIANETKSIFEEYFNYSIPIEEIGFIALHIASAIEKSKKPLNTCILYNSSYSEVKLMIEILKNNFNQLNITKVMPLSMVNDIDYTTTDLIISTKALDEKMACSTLLLPSILVYKDLRLFGEIINKTYEEHNRKLLEL